MFVEKDEKKRFVFVSLTLCDCYHFDQRQCRSLDRHHCCSWVYTCLYGKFENQPQKITKCEDENRKTCIKSGLTSIKVDNLLATQVTFFWWSMTFAIAILTPKLNKTFFFLCSKCKKNEWGEFSVNRSNSCGFISKLRDSINNKL